jgi:hypothetical protein
MRVQQPLDFVLVHPRLLLVQITICFYDGGKSDVKVQI